MIKLPDHVEFSWHVVLFGCLILNTASIEAQQQVPGTQPLPEPLTLEYALSMQTATHPELQRIDAAVRAARAEQQLAESKTGITSWVEARIRYVQPPGFVPDRSHDDHRLGLFVNKTLYDFGRSDAALSAARKSIASQQLLYQDELQQRRIEIMRRYFDVVLADVQFYRFNEEMATEFVSLDRLRDKRELGQVSDIEVLRQQSVYQKVRKLRFQAESLQRVTRARLAYALGRPGELPTTVSRPANLPGLERKLPEVDQLQAQALENNALLKALRAQIAAAQARVGAARAGSRPLLTGGAEANAYSKERAGYDSWRVNVTLKVPLASGGEVDAEMAQQRAALYRLQADYANALEQVKQQVLETWLELDTLRVQREQMQTQAEYRELYLDRSRALYELEVKTDLGDAMVRVTETEREALATDFNTVLGWEKLDALVGADQAQQVKQ